MKSKAIIFFLFFCLCKYAVAQVEFGVSAGITHSYISARAFYDKQLMLNPSFDLLANFSVNENAFFSAGMGMNAKGGRFTTNGNGQEGDLYWKSYYLNTFMKFNHRISKKIYFNLGVYFAKGIWGNYHDKYYRQSGEAVHFDGKSRFTNKYFPEDPEENIFYQASWDLGLSSGISYDMGRFYANLNLDYGLRHLGLYRKEFDPYEDIFWPKYYRNVELSLVYRLNKKDQKNSTSDSDSTKSGWIGWKAGLNSSRIIDRNDDYNTNGRMYPFDEGVSFNAGFVYEEKMYKNLSFTSEVIYTTKGDEYKYRTGNFYETTLTYIRLHYLELPILLKYSVNRFYVKGGFAAGIVFGSPSVSTEKEVEFPSVFRDFVAKDIDNRYELNLQGGVGINLINKDSKKLDLDFRYSKGLSNVFEYPSTNEYYSISLVHYFKRI